MKQVYKLIINKDITSTKRKSFSYKFGKSKSNNVFIYIQRNAVRISVETTIIKTSDEIYVDNDYLSKDALTKALILHLIIYSKPLKINSIVFISDKEYVCIYDKNKDDTLIYSLVEQNLPYAFSNNWDKKSIEGILLQKKSSYDNRLTALYALITSKTQRFESERFIYLWMSFNGMSNYFSKMIHACKKESDPEKIAKEEAKKTDKGNFFRLLDAYQMQCMRRYLGIKPKIKLNDKDKKKIVKQINDLLKKLKKPLTKECLYSNDGNEIVSSIKENLSNMNIDISKESEKDLAYGCLLTIFAYDYRCNLLHASRTITLFSFKNDEDIYIYKMLNSLLEEFIEENLPSWFDDDFIKGCLKDKAMKIAKLELSESQNNNNNKQSNKKSKKNK